MADHNPSQHQEGKAESPMEKSEIGGVENHKKTDKGQPATEKKKTSTDKFLRWASFTVDVLVFIAVGAYTIVAWQQLREMRIDRRAWAAVGSAKGFPKGGEPFRWTIVLTNTGKTFAKHVNVAGSSGWYAEGQHPDFVKQIKESAGSRNPEKISDALLAPNATTECTTEQKEGTRVFSAEEIETLKGEISHDKLSFISFGQITYDDIFGHHHWLIFCNNLMYDKRRTENEGWGWNACKEWNDTGDGDPPVRY